MAPSNDPAWQLQQQADAWAADLGSQDPPAAGGDLAWQQEQIRDAYQDAAYLSGQ